MVHKKHILMASIWLFSQVVFGQDVVSFKDWKNQQIQEVLKETHQLEAVGKDSPSQFGPEEKAKLKQLKINLEISKDLNAQDYFVLYLSPQFQNNQEAFTKAVQMMSPEDIAQILIAYNKLIEERRKKNLLPVNDMKFSFSTPKKLAPEAIISSVSR